MKPTIESEELPNFHRVAYGCTLMAQAVVMGIIKPIEDGRLQARLEELERAFDTAYANRPRSMRIVQKFQDAREALQVAYTKHEESSTWEGRTYREQRWSINPRFFDTTTDLGWRRMRALQTYIDEALPGQRNFDPAFLLELPPENLKKFDWDHFPRDENPEIRAAASPHAPDESMMAVEDDPKWRKAQALVDDRLAETFMKYELETKSLPKQP